VAIGKSISLILDKTTGQLSEAQGQLLSIADRNLKRLTFLINDLLDLSKLEAGKMSIRREYSSIEKIIFESIDGLKTWTQTKSIKIEKDIEEGLPEVYIDPHRIIQVFNNLIGNSIKFTPTNGTIVMKAKLRKENQEIEISVQDTGIGISKENLSKVFDKFYQTGERVATDISGTGIGLSIAKEIVELHGGHIWAESEKGKGTEFIFTIPLKPFGPSINSGSS
jgi:signal transduction histidine kinase